MKTRILHTIILLILLPNSVFAQTSICGMFNLTNTSLEGLAHSIIHAKVIAETAQLARLNASLDELNLQKKIFQSCDPRRDSVNCIGAVTLGINSVINQRNKLQVQLWADEETDVGYHSAGAGLFQVSCSPALSDYIDKCTQLLTSNLDSTTGMDPCAPVDPYNTTGCAYTVTQNNSGFPSNFIPGVAPYIPKEKYEGCSSTSLWETSGVSPEYRGNIAKTSLNLTVRYEVGCALINNPGIDNRWSIWDPNLNQTLTVTNTGMRHIALGGSGTPIAPGQSITVSGVSAIGVYCLSY